MREVDRIIRVDHAGELGAIQIYRAQILVSRLLHKPIVAELEEMLQHEQQHFGKFDRLLNDRGVRPCYALSIWAVGGFLLGFVTALVGRNAIWVCTQSIETTVLHHLDWQLSFLAQNDRVAHDVVMSIKGEEETHRDSGAANGSDSFIYKPVFWMVRKTTECAIWLSTKL